ncbi:unnamed protein product, partial [Meganyctiphanes norvegica]
MENYEVVQCIGRGAFGNVYLYNRLTDKKQVVIKQIPIESVSKDESQITKNEVRVLAMLKHPNIIEYYDNHIENMAMMIVMEYAPGGNLYDYLRSRGDGNLLQEEDILNLFCQLVLGMQHIHELNILHRDLKSHNILLDRSHRIVKIGDFGISKILNSKSKAHTVVGTPCYLSPELCQEKPYNQKSDIWALGCVLYEIVTLKRAFEAETLPALIRKIMRGIPEPINSRYSDEMCNFVSLLLHIDPTQRPNIFQVIAQPIIFPTLFKLHVDLGMVRCVSRPQRLSSVGTRSRSSRSSEDSVDQINTDKKPLTKDFLKVPACEAKPPPESAVFFWRIYSQPTRLTIGGAEGDICSVACSDTEMYGATSTGQLIAWEITQHHQHKESDRQSDGIANCCTPKVSVVPLPTAINVVQVDSGNGYMAVLTTRGIVLSKGNGSSGALGHGSTTDVTQLQLVEALLGISAIQISCGAQHMAVLSQEKQVYIWGTGDNGRLGIGTRSKQLWPQHVDLDDLHMEITGVVCGPDLTFLTTTSGVLFAAGSNRCNKLCVDETDAAGFETLKQVEDVAKFVPVCSRPLANSTIMQVAAGKEHSAFITSDGEVFASGSNTHGQLGHFGSINSRVPVRVMEPVALCKAVYIAAGDMFTVIVTKGGEVYTFGSSSSDGINQNTEVLITSQHCGDMPQNKEIVEPHLVNFVQKMKTSVTALAPRWDLAASLYILLCHQS